MARIYLHIGMPKTGTSFLQYFLQQNEKALQEQNIAYPNISEKIGIKQRQHKNAFFLKQTDYAGSAPDTKILEAGWKELAELSKQYRTIILSEEGLWRTGMDRPDFWTRFVEDARKIGCDVKVIAYLRRQDEFIQSLWAQNVKSYPRLDKTFSSYIKEGYYQYFPLDYYQSLTHIAGHIGRENLLVRIYENGQFQGEDHTLLSDFMEAAGIRKSPDFQYGIDNGNFSLHGNYVEIRRRINQMPDYKDMWDFMKQPIIRANSFAGSSSAKESYFTYEEQVAFLRQYEESNKKVAQDFLGRKDGVLFYQPVKHAPLWTVEPQNLAWDLLYTNMEIMIRQQKELEQSRQETALLQKETALLKQKTVLLEKEIYRIEKSLIFRLYRKLQKLKG